VVKGYRVIMVKTMGWLGEVKGLRLPDAKIGKTQRMVTGFAAETGLKGVRKTG
jgi:hypothetical protein